MMLKLFGMLVVVSLGVTLLMRQPRARTAGWIVTASLVVLGLLVVQLLRVIDSMWR